MNHMPINIVVDTSVLIAALRSSQGASFYLLSIIEDRRVRWNLSVALALEYESVAKRFAPELRISHHFIDDILDTICENSRHHSIHFLTRPALDDPDDEFVLELACASNCAYLITHNVRDFAAAADFGVTVVTPGEFLRILKEEGSK